METALQIIGGLILLALGGEAVVRGAVGVARRLGVSELMIGLTLVAFGTSTPELLTSVNAAMSGAPGIAIGNVVGSNIGNILLIFAIVVIVKPVDIDPKAISRDGLIMVGVTLLLIILALTFGELSRLVGFILVAGLIGYIFFAYNQEKKGGPAAELHKAEAEAAVHKEDKPMPLWQALGFALVGLALLVVGADNLVKGAITLATLAGLSETIIGLTIVAIGTSLPELVASLVAALRGRADVAFGNIVGSNLYNILGILGVTALVAPVPIPPDMVARDWIALLGAAVLLLYHAWTGRRVTRLEGGWFLTLYAVYCWFLLNPGGVPAPAPTP
jgi:cation:H+ antiporter